MGENRSWRPPLIGDKQTRRTYREQSDAMRNSSEFVMETLYVEPGKPRIGMVVFADGTEWNPGSGEGLYIYKSGGWTFLG